MFSRKASQATVPTVSTSSSTSTAFIPSTPTSPSVLSLPTTPSAEYGFNFTASELKASPPSGNYSRSQALDDLPLVRHALHMFLGGKMLEAEKICKDADPHCERLYTAAGIGLVQALKGLMSFEDADINRALDAVKHAALVANQHRRPTSLTSRLAGLVVGGQSGVGFMKGMTPVERHAELVHCECLLQKAILGIVSSGDWLTFIREFINIRSATNVFRTLGEFVRMADAEATARGEGPEDKTIDDDFRSGVLLGVGINSLCLTMLPDSVGTIVALFGYKGDRHEAIAYLNRPGGWSSSSSEPGVPVDKQGLRRSSADLTLLIFHLFISNVTYTGVDIAQARNIVAWNLKLYPKGVFFLFLTGRLHVLESRLDLATEFYKKVEWETRIFGSQTNIVTFLGMELTEYQSLKGVAQWEIGLYQLTEGNFGEAVPFWRAQDANSNWSKAVYAYGLAVCLYEMGGETNLKEAAEYFAKVPTVTKRIAGKSLPAEKYVSRKSRKFASQGQRLIHPAIEFSYMLGAIQHTPRTKFLSKTLPALEKSLKKLQEISDPTSYEDGQGYWDDFASIRFLYGVCMRYLAYPHIEAIETEEEKAEVQTAMTTEDAIKKSFECFQWVIDNGLQIETEHQFVYCAHYEIGRLYACTGDVVEARKHLKLVASGKPLEVNAAGRTGSKYSMQNALQVKTSSALDALEGGRTNI